MTSLLRIGLILILISLITIFDWPDISSYLSFIQTVINRIYTLNEIIDIDTAYTLFNITLGIEIILLVRKITVGVIHFISSGSFKTHSESTHD